MLIYISVLKSEAGVGGAKARMTEKKMIYYYE